MTDTQTQALAKIDEGAKAKGFGNVAAAMKDFIATALRDFIRQDAEFAQAVVQGGSFAECMAAVAKGVGSHISDFDAYGKAAAFYFPGCKIRYKMELLEPWLEWLRRGSPRDKNGQPRWPKTKKKEKNAA